MTVDTYAVCPCGNGKKIKFCKCKDSVHELDAVIKMVEGGQVVPALDRLSTILQENPDAAWALAIRGRLLLDLREYESLSENAERFIRLQPSNPLALTQRAAAMIFKGDAESATSTILQALTESGRDVDSFVLDVASVLAFSLAQSGAFLTARVYATLAMMASGYEGGRTAVSVLRQLNQAPTISQLMKSIPETIERPADASWGERYDEAAGLLQSNQVLLAENKFQSLQRTVADEPAILSGLLTCAIWRGDTDTQSDMLRKLSECESLDFDTRAKYLAMSAMAKPSTPDVCIPTVELTCDIENTEEIELSMTASSYFVSLPPDLLSGMRASEDDIPPRAGFQILDREKPTELDKLPPISEVPEAVAMVFIYGKQTDRAARIEVVEVRQDRIEQVKSRINDAVESAFEFTQSDGEPLPLLVASQPAIAMVRFQASPLDAEKLQLDLVQERMPEAVASLKLPLLGNASLKDLAGDESKLLVRTAVMQIIEQYDAVSSKLGDSIEKVYEFAGLQRRGMIVANNEDIESLANEDLAFVDPSQLNTESLIYLVQRAQQVSSTNAMRRFASALLESEMSEEQRPAKLLAYMTLINTATDNAVALKLLEEAKAFAAANQISTANLLLTEIGLRLQGGDGPGFQSALQAISSQYGQEPEVMAQLQQMLMAYGLIGPDGRPRGGPGGPPSAAAPAAAGGGLWTPDGGAPAPSPAAGGEGDGGSKLWVPGMD
ncbi:hypothetical protein Pla22_02950 [Rubripirellula amarantea]|uniref:Uncharacterized protein n=1 Tax=Rubripirellula amarantea TaxID=2527999 RepID=A0A5C5WR69_9BACT|nr:protein-disulfide isomerase [Rubripirellula amarantea]TWT52669.1 hypothetical protein Pla22_02950 [Rubripirellula amarantea]